MRIDYAVRRLDTQDDFDRLADVLGGHAYLPLSIIRHLRALGVQSYVIEDPYIDRDYSADYSHFYAQTFRRHKRHCQRLHFFAADIGPFLRRPLSTDRLREVARQTYSGFCVLRPLPNAPIGRTVLCAHVPNAPHMEAAITCRAAYSTNLLGVDLQVTGAPFLQQDARVGACAQVAIWAGMRHMHARHGYNWLSVADITRMATPTTTDEAVSLPAGSDFLTSEKMIRAVIAAGYQPLCFSGQDIGRQVLPYVESGIPVILGLQLGGTIGHAVTVVGRVFAKRVTPTNQAIDYVDAYIVHDDQVGPYRYLPLAPGSETVTAFSDDVIAHSSNGRSTVLDVDTHAVFAVALMSRRVFAKADAAELSALDRFSSVLDQLPAIRKTISGFGYPVCTSLLDKLQAANDARQIVLRTYLTSAAGYRRHLVGCSASDRLKDALLEVHLPHFTWITELSSVDAYNQAPPSSRRIYGHTVLDATSTCRNGDGLLVLHLPGLLFTVGDPDGSRTMLSVIEDDRLYEGRRKRL